jgi:hypothetical protein
VAHADLHGSARLQEILNRRILGRNRCRQLIHLAKELFGWPSAPCTELCRRHGADALAEATGQVNERRVHGLNAEKLGEK